MYFHSTEVSSLAYARADIDLQNILKEAGIPLDLRYAP